MKIKRNGFTFIELMVVMTIGAIIFAVTTVTYRNVTIDSRNARRKSDVEAIRQALELCRSYAGAYPNAVGGLVPGTITCGGQTYMQTSPVDPKTGTGYAYVNTASTYTVTATLENTSGGTTAYPVNNP